MSQADAVEVVQRRPNRPQARFLTIQGAPGGAIQYFDLEGATGSGKTTAPAWKMLLYATRYPGIHMGMWAWTEDMLGPPKNAFLQAAREDGFSEEAGTLKWHGGPGDDYFEFVGYGSKVYLRSMRASEDSMRTQKLAGMDLSIVWIDQPDAIDSDNEDVYRAYVPARLRQSGPFPKEVWLSPNPLSDAHWLSKEFPVEPRKALPNHHYVRFELRDNVGFGVSEQYLLDMETAHPPGSPTRARQVDGSRAPIVRGKPIYGPKLFKRQVHVRDVEPLGDHPIHDGWDFGQLHPACVFVQLTWWGQLRILGSIEGDDIFLEHFAPLVKDIRAEWFGAQATYETTCDPAGTTGNAHGTMLNGIKILNAHDIFPVTSFNLNRVEGISYAIETVGGFMSRDVVEPEFTWCGCAYCEEHYPGWTKGTRLPAALVVSGGQIRHGRTVPAFLIDSERHIKLTNTDRVDWPVLINGFSTGYVHDSRAPVGQSNLKRPLKDGEHDHTQRCVEYIVQQYWKQRPAGEQLERDLDQFARRAEQARQRELSGITRRDFDPADARRRGRVLSLGSRGGSPAAVAGGRPFQSNGRRGGW